jgi:hypothetical protein
MPAAAVPWVSAGLGALGLFEQSQANRGMEGAAGNQLDLQRALIAQQMGGYNQYANLFHQAQQNGQFNPARLEAQAAKDLGYNEATQLGNEAAGARVLGYRPGDSAPLSTMNATRGDFALRFTDLMNQIRNQAYASQMASAGALLPNSSGAAIGALGENARFDVSREVPLGGLLGSLAPYLAQLRNSGNGNWQGGGSPSILNDPGYGAASGIADQVGRFFGGGSPSQPSGSSSPFPRPRSQPLFNL